MKKRVNGRKMNLGVCIAREAPRGFHRFLDVFGGFERVAAVRSIFGPKTKAVLGALWVEITDGKGYMRINDEKGSIVVNGS